jgi:hypothetical protein
MKSKKPKEKEAQSFRIAIYLLVFFLALFLFSNLISHIFGAGSGIEKCKGIIFQSFREDCFQKLALQTNNISICNFTINKGNCLTSIAIAQRNISICNEVGIECVNSVVNLVGESECLKLAGNLRDYCLLEKASNATNESICSLVENSSLKDLCKITVLQKKIATSKNFSICENLPGIQKLVCLESIAEKLNTSIPEQYLSLFNYSQFYLNLSVSDLTDLTKIIESLSVISQAISTKNLSICSTLPTNQSISCYLLFALNTTNISICNYLPSDKADACKKLVSFYISKKI